MTRNCRCTTGDDQRLQMHYKRRSETAGVLQQMTRNCICTTGDDQRLRVYYNR
ncbi:unnamed protein product [Staurois parvus]|uniref:Uncharacterized protein n=1 Tax=Staurois parvus TaxID=386267 RepID=A0ABN9EH53_9NEOB|nr:unnamed protein product [Staurois parvus]